MAELGESDLITEINAIDTQIATIRAAISATSGAHLVDYEIGNKRVDASQKLDQLLKMRETYQKLLQQVPKTITRHHQYEKEQYTGRDLSEEIGDD